MSYTPTTPFRPLAIPGSPMVYNLRPKSGFWKGDAPIEKDVTIRIEGKLSDEDRAAIAQLICDTLNARYPVAPNA